LAEKRRIFQVAKELNISNEALIAYLEKHEFQVKTHMSPITEEMYAEICKKYKAESTSGVIDEDVDFRKRLREKKLEEEKRRERTRLELEDRLRITQEVAKKSLKKRREPSKEEVLKIAEEEAKAEAKAELLNKGWKEAIRHDGLNDNLVSKKHDQVGGVEAPIAEDGFKVDKKQAKSPPRSERSIDQQTGTDVEVGTPEDSSDELESPEETVVQEAKSFLESKDEKTTDKAETGDKKKDRHRKGLKEVDKSEEKTKLKTKPAAKVGESTEDKKRKKRRKKKRKISDEEIEASIRQTLAAIQDTGRTRKRRRRVKSEEDGHELEEISVIKAAEFISTADLAKLMDIDAAEVLRKCLELGMMVSINQRLDMDTIVMVADEFGFEVEKEEEFGVEIDEEIIDDENDLEVRPPVVTIMGHVDHGKTSLLDYIRRSNIISGEAGGITQHIGAYEVTVDGRQICFLDTPGHEAFTAMRARGAQATDIVVLIVAADDGVQKQTVEAINHAKAAGVPIVVAVNKIDRPSANPDNIKQQLSQNGILVESWGGKHQSADISARTGDGIDKLLESILLEADVLELKANPNRLARGIVIESELDRGKGPVATVLVQAGSLKVGDPFVAGVTSGKVRAMFDERGKRVKKALPSTPVRVVGFMNVAQAGDKFVVLESDKEAKEISIKRQQLRREHEFRKVRHRTLDQISKQIAEGEVRELKVIVKGDVDGSVEAIADSLMKLSTKEVAVDVLHKGVGAVSEADVNFAVASDAIIIGFNVRVSLQARELSKKEDIDIRIYKVIYDAVNDVKTALEGLLEPEMKEEVTATVEVRQTFKVPKIGTVAGCYVLSGKVKRNDLIRVFRDDKLIYEGKISSLKRFKDDVREVASGFECGIGIANFDDVHVNDIFECLQVVEVKRTLA
jgi:translation initiation factor IF-2